MKTWFSKIRVWEIALLILVGFISHFVFTLESSQKQITAKTVVVLDHADKSLTNIDTTVSGIGNSSSSAISNLASDELKFGLVLDKLTALCTPVKGQVLSITDNKNCGTLADISRTLQTLRGTMGTIETAGLNFDRHQGDLYNQEQQLFTHADNLVQGFIPIQSKIDKTIFDADSLINSPDVTGTFHHVNSIADNFDGMSTDTRNKFHAFLYPAPCKGFKCNIAKSFEYIKLGSQFMEPAYWGYQLFTSIH